MQPFDGLPEPPDDRPRRRLPEAIQRDLAELESADLAEEFSPIADDTSNPLPLGRDRVEFWEAPLSDSDDSLQCVVRGWRVGRTALPKRYGDARPDLIPIVRSLAAYHAHRLRMEIAGRKTVDCPYHRVSHHLAAWLAHDPISGTMQTVTQEELDAWGVSFLDAMHAALVNLWERGDPFDEIKGCYVSRDAGESGASWLLVWEALRRLPVKGDVIAMAVNPDMLIITGSDDHEGLRTMLRLMRTALKKRGQMSTMAMCLEPKRWAPWVPPLWHPLFNKFYCWRMRSRMAYYRTQELLLKELYEAGREPVEIIPFRVLPPTFVGLPMRGNGGISPSPCRRSKSSR
jgi:hypothetical protein